MSDPTPPKYQSLHILTSSTHLLSISLLSYLISRKAPPINKLQQWKSLRWGKVCMFLVLIDSWFFVLFSGILLTGIGTMGDPVACSLAIFSCILFQGSSKVLIYAFFVEKVYIVWSGGNRTPRLKTKVYKICSVILLGYVVIDVLFFLGHASHIREEDGVCILGYKNYASIALVTYDLVQNVFFTIMFLWPLWRSRVMSPRLRNVAKKTFYGAVSGLTISAANTVVLIALRGTELSWVCMNSCVADVAANALILYWVSSGTPSDSVDHFTLPEINVTNITVGNQWKAPAMTSPSGTMDTSTTQTASIAFQPGSFRAPGTLLDAPNESNKMEYFGDEEKGYASRERIVNEKHTLYFTGPINMSSTYPPLYSCGQPHHEIPRDHLLQGNLPARPLRIRRYSF
ncbi:hypothetical protein Moror_16837 [Moniliophthora roreri MCA 2997]|uniref:Transmembrane protein n=1 Tax=Moniliophthora roreri (strain MCA 2997) TaxID=1381753 RepID=V2XBC1_MONRO|nr:hypothetical protein Moror_16837 [Moniliophthora roreri MCA 2997]